MKICFATNNPNKVKEVEALLQGYDFEVVSLKDIGCEDDVPETSDSIEGNSLQKARYVFKHYQVPCFADDTGLEVDFLNGDPGIYSARYAGEQRNAVDNNRLLLQNLDGVDDRNAQFKTVVTWVNGQEEKQFVGIVKGEILEMLSGFEGFGYDPLFRPIGFEETFAQMSTEQKNSISHRALATRQFIDYLTAQKK